MMHAVSVTPLHYSPQAAAQTRARMDARVGIKEPGDADAGGRDYMQRVPRMPVRPRLDPPRLHGFSAEA